MSAWPPAWRALHARSVLPQRVTLVPSMNREPGKPQKCDVHMLRPCDSDSDSDSESDSDSDSESDSNSDSVTLTLTLWYNGCCTCLCTGLPALRYSLQGLGYP
eukprot:361716-Chlamydomonas_euryale.AAC.6